MADEAVLNRVEQARVYGIDCGDEILFGAGAWAPGGEHTKKLVVKNVCNKTIKFKYDLPRTKYFSMDFPLLITLSPGTSRVLDIAFRPVQYEEYDDCIRFTVHIIDGGVKATNGTFRLPVKARIAMLRVELPSGLDFGFCPTAETTDVVFQLKSTGQIDASFRWSLPDAGEHGRPFKITPSSGEIKAGQVLDVTARFAPQTASVYVVTALFAAHELGETHQHQETTLKISGIGKFAYFATSETELDFGDMLVNGPSTHKSPTEREFVLRNRSLVRASFHIFPIETDHEPTFFFSPLKGTIPPESALPIRVKYTPLSPGTFTCDNFKIVTPGGHAAHIVCKGKAIGPLVSLWKKNRASNLVSGHSVNFRDVRVGETATRVLYLRNEAAIPVRFHLVSAANGIFGVSKVAGEIPPLLEASVLLTFAPLSPGNYYRRLFCLLQNQATMFVDVLGTGYDAEIRPSPFEQGHVDAYRLRCEHNLGHLSPDGLEALWGDKGDALFLQGALARQREAASRRETTRLLTRSGDMLLADVDVCHEFFIQPDDRHGAIFASDALLDFGVGFDIKKTLLVTNQTRGKVTCTWRIAEAPTAVESSNFTIFPTTCDIGPGASAEFRVGFHPKQSNTYFFAELESSVYFKSNRTFRLVNPETFTPPWCIVVQATGHTFASTDSQFLSRVTYATAKDGLCAFPPAFIGDSVFQTVVLMNSSDTPAVFAITQDPSRVFRAKPSCGLIPPNGFHLVQIRFSPTKSRRYSHMLKTTVNHSTSVALELTGTGCFPHLICQELDGGPAIDKLFIKPTSIGLSSTRLFRVKNGCRIPLVFRWSLPPSVQDVFQLSPLVHRLLGNEASVIACVFAPSLIKQYNQRLTLHVKSISMARGEPPSSHLPILQDVSIKVTGVGTTGAVAFEPAELTLPTVLVNSDATGPFQLVNGSDCDLQFELRVTVLDSSKLMARPHLDKKLAATYVSFSKPSGVIGARSTQQVGIAFRGDLAGSYDYGIQCAIATLDAVVLPSHHGDDDSVNCVEMQVHASASFPTLFFEDIRLAQTPTAVAWAQFQCEEINAFMAAPLTNDELKLNSESSPDLSLLKVFPLRFTPNVIGTHTEDVVIQLRNPGSLVVDFRIFYPNESDIEIEPWADTSEPTTDELRQNIIIDSKLFTVAPRKGVLQPHESLLLRLSYAYASMQYDGVHDLQLLVSVSQGKKMMLSLHGRTLPKASPLLFLPRTNWVLSPVMLSESGRKEHLHARPALQQFQVFNRGDAPFLLDIDDADLARINATSHNFPILECLTQRVSVPPNASVFLDLEFCPLEQLTYHGTLLLSVEGLESGYQEQFKLPITARGYDASKTSFAMTRDSIVRGGPPTVQKAPPESRAALSCDVLDLGHVCVHTEHTRLVVLTNLSATATLSFAWDANHHLVHANRVRFFPMQGRLSPLEHCMVRVTVAPAADLLVIDHDIACWVRLLHDAAASSTLESAKTTREAKPSDTRPSVLTRTTISSRAHFSRDEPATTEDYTPPLALALPKLKPKPAPASGMRSPKGPRRKPSPTRGNSSRKARFADGSDAAESDETLRGSKVLQPLYIHVFAHVLPLETFRRQLTREDFERRPLAIPSGETRRADDLEALRTAWRVTKDPAAMSESRHVIEGVLSHLVTDLFGTGTIDQAVDELLPTEPETPYFVQFGQPACDKRRARLGRLLVEDDFRRIASLVLENTMLNVVQEIGLGEFDLACLPKQLVFLPDEET